MLCRQVFLAALLFGLGQAQEECLRQGECTVGNIIIALPAVDTSECRDYCASLQDAQDAPECSVYTFYSELGMCELYSSCVEIDDEYCSVNGCLTGLLNCQPRPRKPELFYGHHVSRCCLQNSPG